MWSRETMPSPYIAARFEPGQPLAVETRHATSVRQALVEAHALRERAPVNHRVRLYVKNRTTKFVFAIYDCEETGLHGTGEYQLPDGRTRTHTHHVNWPKKLGRPRPSPHETAPEVVLPPSPVTSRTGEVKDSPLFTGATL